MVTIYKVTSPSGKLYIGQTRNYKVRLQEYKRLKCTAQVRLYASLKKYGFNAHKFEIVETCSIEQCDERETYWISSLNTFKGKNGLNATEGGHRPAPKKGKAHYKAKIVYQWDLNGNFIKKWDCIRDVQSEHGWSSTTIGMSVKSNTSCYGYRWTFENISPGIYRSQRVNKVPMH